eukprot:scaffold659371_cov28-Prasinocladus_malaysianus.AAC.1
MSRLATLVQLVTLTTASRSRRRVHGHWCLEFSASSSRRPSAERASLHCLNTDGGPMPWKTWTMNRRVSLADDAVATTRLARCRQWSACEMRGRLATSSAVQNDALAFEDE